MCILVFSAPRIHFKATVERGPSSYFVNRGTASCAREDKALASKLLAVGHTNVLEILMVSQ